MFACRSVAVGATGGTQAVRQLLAEAVSGLRALTRLPWVEIGALVGCSVAEGKRLYTSARPRMRRIAGSSSRRLAL